MDDVRARAERFLAAHRPGEPLVLANAWDAGSARLFAAMGFEALATTSSGIAATFGRRDGHLQVDEALAAVAAIAAAVEVPVTADLEDGFAADPAAVARLVERARDAGVAGLSIEDYGAQADALYDANLATERIAAAAEAAHGGEVPLVLTARAEGLLHGEDDLAAIIARLRGYQDAGADVLYAPGLRSSTDIGAVVAAVDRPVNVLALAGTPPVAELATLGVARVSVGSGFGLVALAAAHAAARELLESGTTGFWEEALAAKPAIQAAFWPTDQGPSAIG